MDGQPYNYITCLKSHHLGKPPIFIQDFFTYGDGSKPYYDPCFSGNQLDKQQFFTGI